MTLPTARRLAALFFCTTILFAALFAWKAADTPAPATPSPGAPVEKKADDSMKIPADAILDESVKARERVGDHPGSIYYPAVDFYKMKSTETLTILPEFRTFQQTSNDTCGQACALMVLDYYNKRGDWNEETLRALPVDHSDIHSGTCLEQMVETFQKVGGFQVESSADLKGSPIDETMIQMYLADGVPVIIGWADRGGHWQVIIGYDNMGTPDNLWDDVVILADPADDTDHNQDGYYLYSMERLMTCWSFFNLRGLEGHETDYCFVAPRLA